MPAILIQPSAAAGFVSFFGHIAKGAGDTVDLPEGMVNIGGNSKGYMLAAQDNWDPTANSDGTADALALGDDIYLYAVQPGTGAYADVVASKNSTVPTGYNASSSRKIGGFHYGRVRPIDKRYDTSFNPPTQIVPNSCWDLQHRPKCDPSGMVEVIPGSLWADIYLNTEGAGSWPQTIPESRYGATPLSGTEGYARYLDMPQLAANAGKRLPWLNEWQVIADGSPQGNDNDNVLAWTKTTNTDRAATGQVPKAISCLNVVDCVGNLYEPLLDNYDDTNYDDQKWADDTEILENGKDGNEARGSVYHVRWRFWMAGGWWALGAKSGSRRLYSNSGPWGVAASAGLRCVCDSL